MTPQEYCKQKTKESHSSFLTAFIFLKKEKREALTALYAFCREVDDIADECLDHEIASRKLNWWREEIERLFKQLCKCGNNTTCYYCHKSKDPYFKVFNSN